MELQKEKYTTIDIQNKVIHIHDTAPSSNGLETVLEDVSLVIKDGILTVSGYKWIWKFDYEGTWLEDLKEQPHEPHLKFKYKYILDIFTKTKHPYVRYWYRLKKTKLVNYTFSQWAIT